MSRKINDEDARLAAQRWAQDNALALVGLKVRRTEAEKMAWDDGLPPAAASMLGTLIDDGAVAWHGVVWDGLKSSKKPSVRRALNSKMWEKAIAFAALKIEAIDEAFSSLGSHEATDLILRLARRHGCILNATTLAEAIRSARFRVKDAEAPAEAKP